MGSLASSPHEARNVRVAEGREPVLEIRWGEAELLVQFDVAFESVHRIILVEHLAVRVFEHAFFKPSAPAVRQVKPVQGLDVFHVVQQAPDCQFLGHTVWMGLAADQCASHVGGYGQKLLGEPDIVFVRVLRRQSGQHEAAGDVLPGGLTDTRG